MTYRLWDNPAAGQPDRWVVSRNVYDNAGKERKGVRYI